MKCTRCKNDFNPGEPHFCAPAGRAELYKTSAVLISCGGSGKIYRSIDEVPSASLGKLRHASKGGNSATIVLADSRGRSRIADALALDQRADTVVPAAEKKPKASNPLLRAVLISILLLATALISIVLSR